MKKILILLLLLTATAGAQVTPPFAFWKTSGTAWTPASDDSTALWLDAGLIAGKSAGDTSHVFPGTIGPYGYQLTDALKPLYYPDSIGGRPALLFDGANDIMSTAALTLGGPDVTFAIVMKRNGAVGERVISELSTNNNTQAGGFLFASDADTTRIYFNSGPSGSYNKVQSIQTLNTNAAVVIASSRKGAAGLLQSRIEVNGDSTYYYTTGEATTQSGGYLSHPLFIGARSGGVVPARMLVSEIVMIRRHDYEVIANLRTYLATKYGISLP